MHNGNVKYSYIRDIDREGRVMTIARQWGDTGQHLHYGYAVCNPDADQFRKALGREIASGRMNEKPCKFKPNEGDRVLEAIMRDILNSEEAPKIVKNIASQWTKTNPVSPSGTTAPFNEYKDFIDGLI